MVEQVQAQVERVQALVERVQHQALVERVEAQVERDVCRPSFVGWGSPPPQPLCPVFTMCHVRVLA